MNSKIPRQVAIGAAFAGAVLAATPASALVIQLNNLNNVLPGTQAYYGFTQAARFWEMAIPNNVTVKLNVGFSALGTGILGSTGSTTNVAYVGDVLPALQASGNSALDAIAMANLPTTRASSFVGGMALDAVISAPKANGNGVAVPLSRMLDNDASGNNSAFSANTSLMKALGLTPTYTGTNAAIQADGSVSFSNTFAFDFDPTNGIDADKFDFIGVAIHEIGHALGFRSGVDTYDANTNFAGNLNGFALMSVWDLFRHSADAHAQNALDWAVGGTPFFSIDGGATVYDTDAYLSTGRNFGNGQQASHWRDNVPGQPQLGVMDPTVARGQQSVIDALDLAAMDAMGWNVSIDAYNYRSLSWSTAVIPNLTALPEPGTAVLAAMALGLIALGSRKRSRSTPAAF